jgi:hypothetical protein
MPHPDTSDPVTMLQGVKKRFANAVPLASKIKLRKFRRFVRRLVKQNFKPLSRESDTSFENWIANTHYPEWRKQELRNVWEQMGKPEGDYTRWFDKNRKRLTVVKSFIKDETYPEYKHARAINSRADPFKCLVGPIFKLIEKEVFRHRDFVKNVPVKDRPKYIMEHF